MEHPEDRVFDFDVIEEVRRQRHRLVIAALTVLRAYRLAKPDLKLRPMGDFRDYEWIRGALVWLGHVDPIESQRDLFAHDPTKNNLAAVLQSWDNAYGKRRITVAELGREPDYAPNIPKDATPDQVKALLAEANVFAEAKKELQTALIEEACAGKGKWNARSIGWWLLRNVDKHAGGLCLKRFGEDKNRPAAWAVIGGSGPVKPNQRDVDSAVWSMPQPGQTKRTEPDW